MDLTSFVLALGPSLGAQSLLGGCWTCEDLGVLAPHLETPKRQAAEALSLTWSAQDSSLRSCRHKPV